MIKVVFGFYDKNENTGKTIASHVYSTENNQIIFNNALMDSIFSQHPGLKERTEEA